jgi:hypothetical protein
MMGNWHKVGMSGKKPAIPAEGYTFQTLPALNHKIWEKYKGTELKNAISMFKKSYKDIIALIEKHGNDELFTKKNINEQEQLLWVPTLFQARQAIMTGA